MIRVFKFFCVIGLAILAVACGSPAATTNSATTASTQAANPETITLFLGYIHNVQFAPIYVAIEKGYFKDKGIDLKLEPTFDETDGLTRIGTGQLKFGIISGDQVMLARSQGAPVVDVFQWYQKFPVGVVVPDDSDIKEPKDLAGKVVGVPGKFGASYVGLQALLNSTGLKESDLKEIKAIGFDTAPVVCGKQVDASVVYIANEPALIEKACFKVRVIKISDYANIVSNGLTTNEKTLKEQPELVKAMTSALAQGLADTIADPKSAYAISQKYVQNLTANDPVQMKVLENSLELWKADKYGYSDPAAWKLTQDTLTAMGLLTKPVALDKVYSNAYLP